MKEKKRYWLTKKETGVGWLHMPWNDNGVVYPEFNVDWLFLRVSAHLPGHAFLSRIHPMDFCETRRCYNNGSVVATAHAMSGLFVGATRIIFQRRGHDTLKPIWGSHSGDYEECGLVACNSVYSETPGTFRTTRDHLNRVRTFLRTVLCIQDVRISFLRFLILVFGTFYFFIWFSFQKSLAGTDHSNPSACAHRYSFFRS
jgi:hypothetical protein